MSEIRFEDVTKIFGRSVEAVKDLSFIIKIEMSPNFNESLDQDEIDENKEDQTKKSRNRTIIICLIIIIIMMLPSTLAFLAIF